MRDSIVGDNWIYQTAQAVPVQRVVDEKTGQLTGDLLTGPVRLAFDNLFDLPPVTATMQNPKFGASLLFSPWADFTLFHEDYNGLCAKSFSDYWDASTGQFAGLYSPFRDQREKIKFGGFTPGLIFMSSTSKFKPPVVDINGNPIVDKARVYPGVWAICAVSPYVFNDPRKKGVAFGLQSVMIIGDDTKFGGGAPDTKQTHAAVKGITAPIIKPGIAGNMPGQQAQAPGAQIPGYTPQAAPAPQTIETTYRQAPAPAPQQAPAHQPYMPGQPAPAPATDDDMSFLE